MGTETRERYKLEDGTFGSAITLSNVDDVIVKVLPTEQPDSEFRATMERQLNSEFRPAAIEQTDPKDIVESSSRKLYVIYKLGQPQTVEFDVEALKNNEYIKNDTLFTYDYKKHTSLSVIPLGGSIRALDFGDGTAPAPIVCKNDANSMCRVSVTHRYKKPGIYTVKLYAPAWFVFSSPNPYASGIIITEEKVKID